MMELGCFVLMWVCFHAVLLVSFLMLLPLLHLLSVPTLTPLASSLFYLVCLCYCANTRRARPQQPLVFLL